MSNPYNKNPYESFKATNGYGVTVPRTQAPVPVQQRHSPGAYVPRAPERTFDVQRVITAGGELSGQIAPESLPPFERLYRRLPDEGMFSPSVSPSRPFVFELGAFTVPQRMTLMIFNIRPDIYRFSGANSGDYVPIEERRLGSIVGFELTIGQAHPGDVDFQISPVQIQNSSQQAFQSANQANPAANSTQFAMAQAALNANTQGTSSMMLPQRPERFGAPAPIPFTLYVSSGQTVQARCNIFRPLPLPIAFFEFDMTGLLVSDDFAKSMQLAGQAPQNKGAEVVR